jgi:hypothetical protein
MHGEVDLVMEVGAMEWGLEDLVEDMVVMGKLKDIQLNNGFICIYFSGWGGNDTTVVNN